MHFRTHIHTFRIHSDQTPFTTEPQPPPPSPSPFPPFPLICFCFLVVNSMPSCGCVCGHAAAQWAPEPREQEPKRHKNLQQCVTPVEPARGKKDSDISFVWEQGQSVQRWLLSSSSRARFGLTPSSSACRAVPPLSFIFLFFWLTNSPLSSNKTFNSQSPVEWSLVCVCVCVCVWQQPTRHNVTLTILLRFWRRGKLISNPWCYPAILS